MQSDFAGRHWLNDGEHCTRIVSEARKNRRTLLEREMFNKVYFSAELQTA